MYLTINLLAMSTQHMLKKKEKRERKGGKCPRQKNYEKDHKKD
jgi:hypothetical protein